MLQRNKCCCNDNCFEKSERLFKDKMNSWTCDCEENTCNDNHESHPYPPQPEQNCPDMTLAMAYVKNHTLNARTLKRCDDALLAGTLFEELDKPFTGGNRND